MEKLYRLDGWILKQCTRFSHFCQRTVGLTNFFFAKVGLFISAAALAVWIVNYWFPLVKDDRTPVAMLVMYIIFILDTAYGVWMCDKNEERLYQGEPFFYMGRYDSEAIRITLLIVLFIGVPLSVSRVKTIWELISRDFYGPGMLITYYFLAVTPLPPGISRWRQFINNLSAGFRKQVPAHN